MSERDSVQKIYGIAAVLGMVESGNHEDALHQLVYGMTGNNVINLKRLLNGKQNVWKYQNGEEKSDSDGREKDV